MQIYLSFVLFGGAALFLETFAYTHWRIHRQIARRRVSASVLCLVLLPLAPLVQALTALATLLAVVTGPSVTASRANVSYCRSVSTVRPSSR